MGGDIPQRARREVFAALVVSSTLVAASFAGLPEALGAHPWWAQQTGITGTAGGVIAYGALRAAGFRPVGLALFGAAVLCASVLAATVGKSAFVASYAENALAGKAWYFGWFGIAGAAALSAAALVAGFSRR